MDSCDYCTERTLCEFCDKVPAIIYSEGFCYCDACYNKKASVSSFFKSSKKEYLKKGGKLCSPVTCPIEDHDDYEIDRYCVECKEYACSECFHGKHKGHSYKPLNDLLGTARTRNAASVSECFKRLIEVKRTIASIDSAEMKSIESTEATVKEIEDIFELAKQELSARKEELIEEVRAKNEAYQKSLSEQRNNMKSLFSSTERSMFHGKRAEINANGNVLEATCNHFERVHAEMLDAVKTASASTAEARRTKQDSYSFVKDDIVAYIRRFGKVVVSQLDIPYESMSVNEDEIRSKSDGRFDALIAPQFTDVRENSATNISFLNAGMPMQVQQQQSAFSSSIMHQDEQPTTTTYPNQSIPTFSNQSIPTYSGQPIPTYPNQSIPTYSGQQEQEVPVPLTPQVARNEPIQHIDTPVVSYVMKEDGSTVINWTVDPKLRFFDYSVLIYVGNEKLNCAPNKATSYVYNKPIRDGTQIAVAVGYANTVSEYGLSIYKLKN